jgi:hypothetical protein
MAYISARSFEFWQITMQNKKGPDVSQGLGFLVLKAGLEPARALLPTGF